MSYYSCEVRENSTGEHFTIFVNCSQAAEAPVAAYQQLLETKRCERYSVLLSKCDSETEYLPYPYSAYTLDDESLFPALASMHEILAEYTLGQIQPSNGCSGCMTNQANQLGHMDCPTGCLHDSHECGLCGE